MKKPLIAALALTFTLCCVQNTDAQELPSEGDRTFEITTNPFGGTPVRFHG